MPLCGAFSAQRVPGAASVALLGTASGSNPAPLCGTGHTGQEAEQLSIGSSDSGTARSGTQRLTLPFVEDVVVLLRVQLAGVRVHHRFARRRLRGRAIHLQLPLALHVEPYARSVERSHMMRAAGSPPEYAQRPHSSSEGQTASQSRAAQTEFGLGQREHLAV